MPATVTDRFVDLLERADQAGAVRLVTGLAAQGVAPEELVLDVLAPAQREVGRRWEQGRWSVAQEHAATAVSDTALGLLALDAEPAGEGRHVVVACVEGEWHALAGRMVAEVFRLRGWHVTFLGPSAPADDLGRYAARVRPDLVGLSCSLPVALKGAARSIRACRQAGVPVLAGGTGFGPAGRYAPRLGASAWAPDPAVAAALPGVSPGGDATFPSSPEPGHDEHLALEREKDEIVAAAMAGPHRDDARLREALAFLLSTMESAVFVDDAAVIAACRPAAERLLAAVGPGGGSPAALDALFGLVQGSFPRAWALAEEGRLVGIAPAFGPPPS